MWESRQDVSVTTEGSCGTADRHASQGDILDTSLNLTDCSAVSFSMDKHAVMQFSLL